MHLPLEIGFKLEEYEITASLRRLGDHNFYAAVASDGSGRIINEYIPDYCVRDVDGTLSAPDENDSLEFKTSLARVRSNLSLIMDSPINDKCKVNGIINASGTVYAICDGFDGLSVADDVESGGIHEFGYCVDLVVILCDLAGMARNESLHISPDKHNVVINKDDFMLLYTLTPEIDDTTQALNLAGLLYFLLSGSDYLPVGVMENLYRNEYQRKCYNFLLDTLAERFRGGLIKFRIELYNSYYPSDDEPVKAKRGLRPDIRVKLRLGLMLAIMAVLLFAAGGVLSYYLMDKFFIINI